MPFLPDPALRFLHPANRGVVSFLRCQATRSAAASHWSDESDIPAIPDQGPPPPTADGFLLHTHAGLCRRLWATCSGLPTNDNSPNQNSPPCEALVYGVALLAARGIIFALAFGAGTGEDWLAVRLAGGDSIAAYRDGAEPDLGLGDDWLCLDPWQPAGPDVAAQDRLAYWLERAYQNALTLPERPFG
jgi:hypothetical protein